LTAIKSKNDTDEEMPIDANPGSGILPEINTVTGMDFALENNKGVCAAIYD